MDKWQAIALAVVMIAIFGGMAISEVFASKASVKKAQMGLEQCPREIDSIHTIWVKDCLAYTKQLHMYKAD